MWYRFFSFLDKKRHPRIRFIYDITILLWDAFGLGLSCWIHDTQAILVYSVLALLALWLVHHTHNDGPDNGDDEEDNPDDWPDGDDVERWLWSRTKTTTK